MFHKPVARVFQFVLINPRMLVASVFSLAFVVYLLMISSYLPLSFSFFKPLLKAVINSAFSPLLTATPYSVLFSLWSVIFKGKLFDVIE